jgi:hypothetical protein
VVDMRDDRKVTEERGVHRFSGQWPVVSCQ